MGGNDVEQAIQRLADAAGSLTVDQRLRIAAFLARPATPEVVTPSHDDAAPRLVTAESLVLTVEETAELLRIGRTTVYSLIKTGRLNSVMIGRLRRVRYGDVVAYLDQISRSELQQ